MSVCNTLVMQTGGWIGDMILLTPALRALKKVFPESHIEMLVNPLVSSLMERNPYVDAVIVYDKRDKHKGIRQMRRMANRLRAKSFDKAIILHPTSVRSAVLAYMAEVPERIGTDLRGAGFFLTTRIKRRDSIHEVQRYLDVITPLVGDNENGKLEFWGIGMDDEKFVEGILDSHSGPVIGINPFTTWPSKRWPMERFIALIDLLSQQLDSQIIVTGGSGDSYLGEKIIEGASSKPLNLAGKTTLWQLGALIKRCDLYITCDSGPMHISAAVDTQTIALFGPTDPVRHGPMGEGHIVLKKETQCSPCYNRECRYKMHDCMQAIQVNDVMETVNGCIRNLHAL